MSELADHPQSLIEAYQREILKNSLDRSTTFTGRTLFKPYNTLGDQCQKL